MQEGISPLSSKLNLSVGQAYTSQSRRWLKLPEIGPSDFAGLVSGSKKYALKSDSRHGEHMSLGRSHAKQQNLLKKIGKKLKVLELDIRLGSDLARKGSDV